MDHKELIIRRRPDIDENLARKFYDKELLGGYIVCNATLSLAIDLSCS